MTSQPKKRKCKNPNCDVEPMFIPQRPLQRACSFKCALAVETIRNKEKAEKAIQNQRKENLKTLTDHLNDAQKEFNKFIRLRDRDMPCISCDRYHKGQNHAGHYRTVKAASQLRFNESNCHSQCSPCNNHLSGNIVEYRINLEKKIGSEELARIENDNSVHRYTIEEAKQIKSTYRKKWQELEKQLETA